MNTCWRTIAVSWAAVAVLAASLAAHSARADEAGAPPTPAAPGVGEIDLSLDQAHAIWLVPTIALQRLALNYGGTSPNPGQVNADAIELGLRLISSSNRTRTILVGLDLRQLLAELDGFSGIDVVGTKLGVHVEWQPAVKWAPAIGSSWFFGDTLVASDRGLQFNGTTGTLFTSVRIGSARWFLEAMMGSYNEGPGFIMLARAPGSQSLNVKALSLGAEFPIETVWPEWLKMNPPPPSPAPR